MGYTPKAPPKYVQYHIFTVGNKPPVSKSVSQIVSELGHNKRVIDVLKIDCESCEWSTYRSWLDGRIFIRQILVEVHRSYDTKTIHSFFKFLFDHGYVIFHKEPNIAASKGNEIEFAFLKLDTTFGE